MRVNPTPHHKVTSKILKQPKIHTSDHLHRQPNQQESTQEGERKDLQIAAKRALTMKALHVEWALLCWFKSEICTNITPSCAAKLCTTMYYSFSCCHNANALSCSPALQLRKLPAFFINMGDTNLVGRTLSLSSLQFTIQKECVPISLVSPYCSLSHSQLQLTKEHIDNKMECWIQTYIVSLHPTIMAGKLPREQHLPLYTTLK